MTSIAIRNFDGDVKTRLRTSVAGHGRSMEEKGRLILGDAFERETALAKSVRDSVLRTVQVLRRRGAGDTAVQAVAGADPAQVTTRRR